MIYRRGLKRIVILKARQIGFSTLLGVICADQLCWNTGKQVSLVDKTQEDARQKLKNITVLAYDSLHPELKDRFVVSRANSGEFGVRFFEYESRADLHNVCRHPCPKRLKFLRLDIGMGARLAHAYQHSGNAQFVVSARVRKIALPNLRAVRQYPNSGPPVPKARKGRLLGLGRLKKTGRRCRTRNGLVLFPGWRDQLFARSCRRSCRSARRSCRFSTRAWWPTQAEKNVQAAVAAKMSRSARAIR